MKLEQNTPRFFLTKFHLKNRAHSQIFRNVCQHIDTFFLKNAKKYSALMTEKTNLKKIRRITKKGLENERKTGTNSSHDRN